ncbi:MAG: glutamine--tRNA ligase/YqeY domain fusion protein [Phycisphaeraceae bacterium]|nr:glutamine--tRNA ligase/YqeY domain fusion protein [Phycisphaeraceae bacterium]
MSAEAPRHFIQQIIEEHNAEQAWGVWNEHDAGPTDAPGPLGQAARQRLGKPRVHTRFPPEPNGYLHVGHCKSICLNYGLARLHGGKFNLRFDDTNPAKEEAEYVEAIMRDVRWLGAEFDPALGPFGGGLFFASDYFDTMYAYAEELVRKGKAYVCELSADEVSQRRGTPKQPATSPFRDRPAEESLRLLREMRDGRHSEGAMTLRAKIDLASPNFNLRDPVLYRIVHAHHHNTGDKWHIYPMYDWAHGFEDSIEHITHSLCTLEFENHRPLYNWFIDAVNDGRTADGSGPWGKKIWHSRQIEFAKLIPSYTLLSKRNLLRMVKENMVESWDDPRMPTVSGIRRRGYTPEAIWAFCEDIGVTKFDSVIDVTRLENACRDHLNKIAPRRMAVLNPLRVIIENYPEDRIEHFDVPNNPEDPSAGVRQVPFSREILIERDDFMEDPPKKFFRLSPGNEVRLRCAYWIRCERVIKDENGNITELRCTYDPDTRGGESPPPGPDGAIRKVKATLHWVDAARALPATVRLYDRLFTTEEPGKTTGNPFDDLNPEALRVLADARVEPSLAGITPDEPRWADGIRRFQFERHGYFCIDVPSWRADTRPFAQGALIFNRTVTLKDSWSKAGKS